MKKKLMLIWLALAGMLAGCATHDSAAPVTLKAAFQKDFLIGAALNPSQFCESNRAVAALVKQQFNSISPENILKWEKIHPAPGRYDFTLADRYVEFGVKNKMFIVGHNLVWHEQTPPWVFQNEQGQPVSREVLLARMREHIFAVVGRYRGKIGGWDVVNEALNEDGTLRQSPWRKIIGEDYLLQAYQFTHEADPAAELYYNDYGLEHAAKRAGAISMIKKLQAQGVRLTGVGLQGHYTMTWPAPHHLADTIAAFAGLGVKVMITELDVDLLPPATKRHDADVALNFAPDAGLNPYPNGLPDSVQQQLARRYADLFAVFRQHRAALSRVTFWGVTDGDSWLNDWPVKGRTAYPLLFDRQCRPKAAFGSVVKVAKPQQQVQATQGRPPDLP
jgi:endo-1,4-beta-xylanase